MYHHELDPWPLPKDKDPLYINEPWMIDCTLLDIPANSNEPEDQPDNVRIYLPMDLNKEAILRRLDAVIAFFGEASEENESSYSCAVNEVISELEIYDQIWFVRHMPKEGKHSREAIDLAREIILRLADIPDACAEMFPFETIQQLNEEYIGASSDASQDPNILEFNFWQKRQYKLHLELVGDPLFGKVSDLDMDPDRKTRLLQLAKAEKGISRDIIVPGDMNLHALHYAIQRLFGWQNSHLHKFALTDDDFDRLTHDRFGEYAELCGVLFRFPNDDYSDLYWDDDYKEGSYFKNWLRKKYTAPYRCACIADSWPANWEEVNEFRENFPQFNEDTSLKDIEEKVDMGEDFNCLMERLTLNELFRLRPVYYPENENWLNDIKIQVTANIEDIEDDPETEAQMEAASNNLKYWRQVRDWLDHTKYYNPNNYKSTTRKEFGHSYDEMVAECKKYIPYWTIECSELLDAWTVEPAPNFTELYYQYDYGDDWWIKITVEDVYPVDPQEALAQPVCVAADGLDLVDDCGGVHGYLDMLETIKGPDKKEAKSMREWAKGMGWYGRKREPEKML